MRGLAFSKAYIPTERKIPGVGGWRWAVHPTPEFCVTQRKIYQHVGIFCVKLVSENAKICVSPNAKPQCQPVEYRLRWVPTQHFRVEHVHFMFFVYISFASGTQPKKVVMGHSYKNYDKDMYQADISMH